MEVKEYFTKKLFEILRSYNHDDEEILDFVCYLFDNGLCDNDYIKKICEDEHSCPEHSLCEKSDSCLYLLRIDFVLDITPILSGLQKILYDYIGEISFNDIGLNFFQEYIKNFLENTKIPSKYNAILKDLFEFLK